MVYQPNYVESFCAFNSECLHLQVVDHTKCTYVKNQTKLKRYAASRNAKKRQGRRDALIVEEQKVPLLC